jgi:hypothetical protein
MSAQLGAIHVGSPLGLEWVQTIHFHNFEGLPRTGEGVDSPEFTCFGEKMKLVLYPSGHDSTDRATEVAVKRLTQSKIVVYIRITAKRTKEKGGDCVIARFNARNERDCSVNSSGTPFFYVRNHVSAMLTNGTLVLEVLVSLGSRYIHYMEAVKQQNLSSKCNMRKMFLSQNHADVAFKVGDEIFPAHMAILECVAPELAELCESYSTTNPMPIDDVEPGIFKAMLGFVYGMDIDVDWKDQASYLFDPSKNKESILRVSGKYGMVSMKEEAEIGYLRFLELKVDNAIEHLLFADCLNLTYVKNAVIDFIVENSEKVFESPAYVHITESNALICEIMLGLSKKLAGKKRKSY